MGDKVLIIGGGFSPTGRSLWLRDHLVGLGIDVEYQRLNYRIQGKSPSLIIQDDFSELEDRISIVSHPEMYWLEPMKEPPPDQRKGPKGPRNRWGKL